MAAPSTRRVRPCFYSLLHVGDRPTAYIRRWLPKSCKTTNWMILHRQSSVKLQIACKWNTIRYERRKRCWRGHESEVEAEARDIAWIIKTPYVNACAPTWNLSIPRNHTQHGSHNNVQKLTSTEYYKARWPRGLNIPVHLPVSIRPQCIARKWNTTRYESRV